MVPDSQRNARRLRLNARHWRTAAIAALAALWVLVAAGALVGGGYTPPRQAGPELDLSAAGHPGVRLRLLYPAALPASGQPAILTILARASSPDRTDALTLAVDPADDAAGFVDRDGWPIPGRVAVVPGYPEAAPYALRLAHTSSTLRGGWLSPRRVPVSVYLVNADGARALSELAFSVAIPARLPSAARNLATHAAERLWIPLTAVTLLVAAGWVGQRLLADRRAADADHRAALDAERTALADHRAALVAERTALANQRAALAAEHTALANHRAAVADQRARTAEAARSAYEHLQELLRAERWDEARQAVGALRAIAPSYRDVAAIDIRLGEQAAARQRREALTRAGLDAYDRQDWSAAAVALAEVEQGDESTRDLAFYRRTAALYVDLGSRDRSRRVAAARALGEVGDLTVWSPLIAALGDPADAVADAAEQSLLHAGPATQEALMDALRSETAAVATRSARVLRGHGQAVRDRLLAALREPDAAIAPQVTRLLAELGGRRELAEALLWAGDAQLPALAAALAGEGVLASTVLVEILLKAPPERLGVVLAAIAALKTRADVARPLEEAYRATRDRGERERLERAIAVPAAPYTGPIETAAPAQEDTSSAPAEGPAPVEASLSVEAGAGAGVSPEASSQPSQPVPPARGGRRLRLFVR